LYISDGWQVKIDDTEHNFPFFGLIIGDNVNDIYCGFHNFLLTFKYAIRHWINPSKSNPYVFNSSLCNYQLAFIQIVHGTS